MNRRNISGWGSYSVIPTMNIPLTGWHGANIQNHKLASVTKDFVPLKFLVFTQRSVKTVFLQVLGFAEFEGLFFIKIAFFLSVIFPFSVPMHNSKLSIKKDDSNLYGFVIDNKLIFRISEFSSLQTKFIIYR